ncbi:MAG: ABC transporter ATP-binding protein [Bacillota bacterium]|nr:manganese ABC transporter ATP-binding protein [Bacillota bacterium]REJ34416.1 MAG: manganese ABC transporter ATP-binding protein [Bacillota bacterium]
MSDGDTRICVEVKDLTVGYDDRIVLRGINWTVPCGTSAAIIGPNGGGKSTLLRTLVGRLRPAQGTVRIFGRPPEEARPLMAYLPQNEEIDWRFPIRAIDVVMQGLLARTPWWRPPGKDALAQAMAALERVNLADEAQRPVGALSGGQRQRVLLARALLQDAQLILLDEPATGLDAPAQHELLDVVDDLKRDGRTVIATTHDLNCLTDHFDTVLCLRGEVVCQGPPEEALKPEHLLAVFGKHVPLLTAEGRVTIFEHHR